MSDISRTERCLKLDLWVRNSLLDTSRFLSCVLVPGDSGNLVMRFSCSFKYGTSCHFESSHKNKILCKYISYALLKSVFPKIRVRTWVQVASDWLTYLVYQLEAWFFWQESTWPHVLTLISEKTEFSYTSKFTYFSNTADIQAHWFLI